MSSNQNGGRFEQQVTVPLVPLRPLVGQMFIGPEFSCHWAVFHQRCTSVLQMAVLRKENRIKAIAGSADPAHLWSTFFAEAPKRLTSPPWGTSDPKFHLLIPTFNFLRHLRPPLRRQNWKVSTCVTSTKYGAATDEVPIRNLFAGGAFKLRGGPPLRAPRHRGRR